MYIVKYIISTVAYHCKLVQTKLSNLENYYSVHVGSSKAQNFNDECSGDGH